MRLLAVIVHYAGPPAGGLSMTIGSQTQRLPRSAALNAQLVALHRNFGAGRYAGLMHRLNDAVKNGHTLDVVIITMHDRNALDLIGIEPSAFEIVYFEGDPMMLMFEAQRVVRERLGSYDVYAMLEDDMVISDPAFIDKLLWFQHQFGPGRLLQPRRIEVSKSGAHLGKTIIDHEDSPKYRLTDRHKGPAQLSAAYHGHNQAFSRPSVPHSCSWFVTHEQLARWVKEDCFYDKDISWIDPLVSGATRALALTFDIFKADDPNPFFLEIEHYGVRYANRSALPDGVKFGEDPLLLLARAATEQIAMSGYDGHAQSVSDITALKQIGTDYILASQKDRVQATIENVAMKRILKSRSKTFRHLVKSLTSKAVK